MVEMTASQRFHRIFPGRGRAVDEIVPWEESPPEVASVREAVERSGLPFMPMRAGVLYMTPVMGDGSCLWGRLSFQFPSEEKTLQIIDRRKHLPLLPMVTAMSEDLVQSFCFLRAPEPHKIVRAALASVAISMGLSDCTISPSRGRLMKMPFWEEGDTPAVRDFLDKAEVIRTTTEEILAVLE